jgi:hypothetical protein
MRGQTLEELKKLASTNKLVVAETTPQGTVISDAPKHTNFESRARDLYKSCKNFSKLGTDTRADVIRSLGKLLREIAEETRIGSQLSQTADVKASLALVLECNTEILIYVVSHHVKEAAAGK